MTEYSQPLSIPWTEADSQQFIELGRIVTPDRDQIQETILELIPAETDEPFLAVELGIGSGWLSAAILERFPRAQLIGLDASPVMLREAGATLQKFDGRFALRQFQLESRSWLSDIPYDVRCCVSSLVIHHLDGSGKQALYRDLYQHLAVHGALLISDLVAPRGEREQHYMARAWNAAVERQSLALTGSLDAYRRFSEDHANWYEYPDPVDMPSTIPEHLAWLEEAGFGEADVFWERAGHAVYGGYRGESE